MTETASRFTITLAQLNPIVGDVAGNADKARRARAEAAREGADLVAFPELFLSGYPPEDLVLKPAFQAACRATIEELARETADGLADHDPPVLASRIGQRVAFADAARTGRLVSDIDATSPAAREIVALAAEVDRVMR